MFYWNSLRFRSKDPETRRKAIERLDLEADMISQTFELLAAALKDEDGQVRCAATKGLGSIQSERTAEILIPMLWDRNLEARQAAATALGHLGDARALDPLLHALKDPNPPVRASAAAALRTLGWKPASSEEQALFEVALGHARIAAF